MKKDRSREHARARLAGLVCGIDLPTVGVFADPNGRPAFGRITIDPCAPGVIQLHPGPLTAEQDGQARVLLRAQLGGEPS